MTVKDLEIVAADLGVHVQKVFNSSGMFLRLSAPQRAEWRALEWRIPGMILNPVTRVLSGERVGAEGVECMRQGLVRFRSRGASR